MKTVVTLVLAVVVASQAGAQGAIPGMPIPRGKDSAAVVALFARHMKATGATAGREMPQFMHFKQQMEAEGAPPIVAEFFMIRPVQGTTRVRARSIMDMPMMGMIETVVNGDNGWVLSAASPTPMLLNTEQLKAMVQTASPDPFATMPKGTMTIAPRSTIDGRAMDGVRFVDSLGTDAVLYFDAKTGLASAVRTASSRGMGQDTSMVMILGDYKPFNGSLMPTSMTVRQGGSQTMSMRMTSMEVTPIDTMMFVPTAAVVELLKQKKP